MNDRPQRRWRWYKTSSGAPVAKDEFLRVLPDEVQGRMTDLMQRYREERDLLPREVDNYKNGLYALKVTSDGNEYRCYFSHEGERILLALTVVAKKTQKARLGTARHRLDQWHERGIARRRLRSK